MPARWRLCCGLATISAGAYAFAVLRALGALPCELEPDPQRFCAWWEDSGRLPALVGVPGVLFLGWYASAQQRRPAPVLMAAALVAVSCLGLRAAAGLP